MISVTLLLNIIKLHDWINFLIVLTYVSSNNLLLLEANKKKKKLNENKTNFLQKLGCI